MANRPRSKPETKTNALLSALQFLQAVTKEAGAVYETHCILYNKWATAYNGILSAGHAIEDDLFACPNNSMLVKALAKCGENFSLTQLDVGRLQVKSDKFKAIVKCIEAIQLTPGFPDPPQYDINDSLKEALIAVGVLANENAQDIVGASIYLSNGSVIATDKRAIFEYWHGLVLPYGVSIPVHIVDCLAKTKKQLARLGCSNNSVTFYFNDGSWIKTQLYAEPWPDTGRILNQKSSLVPIPADFFKGLEAVEPFASEGMVYFDAGVLRSHPETGVGASYDLPGLPAGPVFSTRLLALIKPHAKMVDFTANGGTMLTFQGDAIRGVIAGMGKRQ